jgi:hypothetical protein
MNRRSDASAQRRREAADRAAELEALTRKLVAREAVTEDDVALARRRLDESRLHAQEAEGRAQAAHAHSADAHRGAAEVAEQAGRRELADRHRLAAAQDDEDAGPGFSGGGRHGRQG